MTDYSACRITAYIATVVVHMANMVYMAVGLMPLRDDPDLKTFTRLQPRYFTCWNFGLQVIYAVISLFCEIQILKNLNNKKYKLNRHLGALREVLFAGVLFPSTMLVFSVFWSLYYLDRDLIFPKFADRALTPLSNHIIHTLIVPIVLWEVLFRPRVPPKSHIRNVTHLLIHLAVYFCVLAYTYNEHEMWIYPILTKIYGTVYFPIAITTLVLMSVVYYYLQWPVTALVWRTEAPMEKIK